MGKWYQWAHKDLCCRHWVAIWNDLHSEGTFLGKIWTGSTYFSVLCPPWRERGIWVYDVPYSETRRHALTNNEKSMERCEIIQWCLCILESVKAGPSCWCLFPLCFVYLFLQITILRWHFSPQNMYIKDPLEAQFHTWKVQATKILKTKAIAKTNECQKH